MKYLKYVLLLTFACMFSVYAGTDHSRRFEGKKMNPLKIERTAVSGTVEKFVLTYPDGNVLCIQYDKNGVGFAPYPCSVFARGSGCAPIDLADKNKKGGYLHSCHHHQVEGDTVLRVFVDGKQEYATKGVESITDLSPKTFPCKAITFETESTLGSLSRVKGITRIIFKAEKPFQFESVCRHEFTRNTKVNIIYHQLLAQGLPTALYVCGQKRDLKISVVTMENGSIIRSDIPSPLKDEELVKKYGPEVMKQWCKYKSIKLFEPEQGAFYINSEERYVGFTSEKTCDYFLYNVPEGPNLYYGLYMTWKDREFGAGDVWENKAICHWGQGMNKAEELLGVGRK